MRAPRPHAAAIQYRPHLVNAPITPQGQELMAERIIAAAAKAGVPIHQDPTLVALLMQFHLDACIPPDLYEAVAEILAFLYQANEQWKARSARR